MDNLDLDISISQQEDTYYHEYIRLYLANIALTAQVKELVQEKNILTNRLSKYQDQDGYSSCDRNNQRNKRFRRTAHEIERFYKCSVKNCEKSYGSEGSLNQHYKLKHPEIYVTLPNVQSAKSQISEISQNQIIQEEEQKIRPVMVQEQKQINARVSGRIRKPARGKQNW